LDSTTARSDPGSLAPGKKADPKLLALGAILIWSTQAAVLGDSVERADFSTVLLLSFSASSLSLWIKERFISRRSFRSIYLEPGWRGGLLGIWGVFGYHSLLFYGMSVGPQIETNLANYLWPILMVIFSVPLLGERIRISALAGAALGFTGCYILISQGMRPSFSGGFGPAMALMAAVCWSSFSVLIRRLGPGGSDRMACYVGWTALLALPVWALRGHPLPAPRVMLSSLYLGVFPLCLAFVLWERALRRGSPQSIGALSYLTPPLSTSLLAATSGQPISTCSFVGMAMIVVGSAIGGRR